MTHPKKPKIHPSLKRLRYAKSCERQHRPYESVTDYIHPSERAADTLSLFLITIFVILSILGWQIFESAKIGIKIGVTGISSIIVCSLLSFISKNEEGLYSLKPSEAKQYAAYKNYKEQQACEKLEAQCLKDQDYIDCFEETTKKPKNK